MLALQWLPPPCPQAAVFADRVLKEKSGSGVTQHFPHSQRKGCERPWEADNHIES